MNLKIKYSKAQIYLVITAVVILGLGTWIYSRYDVWFGNPEEPTYEGLKEPGRVLLTFGDENELSRNVSWACDTEVQDSYLELIDLDQPDTTRIQAAGEVFQSRSGKMAFYHAKLRELKYETHYRYRAVTNEKPTPWYEFHTPSANRKNFSFLYVGDIQDTIGGETNHVLKEAWRRNPDTEFLLCAGDLVERPIDAYWNEMFSTVDSIGQSMPVLNITGNHDYLKSIIYKLERRFSLVFSYFLDSMVGENQVYTLHYGDMQFFVLDGTREFIFLPAQRSWLEENLRESNAKWKVVVEHQPLYSIKGAYQNVIQRIAFDDLIRKYNVDLVLQGHEHAYARYSDENQGKLETPIYLISHCSPKNYFIQFDDKFQKFGSGSRYYQKISVRGDSLIYAAYDANQQTLYDSLLVIKKQGKENITDFGKNIPERVEFLGTPTSKSQKKFVERINEYKKKHPNRFK